MPVTLTQELVSALGDGNVVVTATQVDAAGNKQLVAASTTSFVIDTLSPAVADAAGSGVTVEVAPQVLNASIDGLGDAVTLYFDKQLDESNLPTVSQFSVSTSPTYAGGISVTNVQVFGNQVRLQLDTKLADGTNATVSFNDQSGLNETNTLQGEFGRDVNDFTFEVDNNLSLIPNLAADFEIGKTVKLAGAEIAAFDPDTNRLFVTSFSGLQVLSVASDLTMTMLGTITLGSNDVNSVAVKNGVVAVAVASANKTDPGDVFFLDAAAELSVSGVIISPTDFVFTSVKVGALPDMLTFTADGMKVLVANEAEQNDVDGNNPPDLVNPEGSLSIIDLSPVMSENALVGAVPLVTTASFAAFNDKLVELKAAGVRLFAGEVGSRS